MWGEGLRLAVAGTLWALFFSLFSDGLSTRIVRLESSGDSPGVFVLEAD